MKTVLNKKRELQKKYSGCINISVINAGYKK